MSDHEGLKGVHEQPKIVHSEDKDQLDLEHGEDDDEASHEDHNYEEVQGGQHVETGADEPNME